MDIARLKLEYEKIQKIEFEHLVKIYRAAESDARFVLIMEDFDGTPLPRTGTTGRLTSRRFL